MDVEHAGEGEAAEAGADDRDGVMRGHGGLLRRAISVPINVTNMFVTNKFVEPENGSYPAGGVRGGGSWGRKLCASDQISTQVRRSSPSRLGTANGAEMARHGGGCAGC
ncbi:hypothetical protein GCM10010151_58090 [Actinoallomurus spadix]|uniref:Uncharacterized protein n=1 Tax=Actinoallomurus spadix TaxID=79912 RepID=A0ABN0XCA8_9ACTN